MEQLWAPWRLAYAKTTGPNPSRECFVCRVYRETADRENLVLYRSAHSVVVQNRFPYNNGHLLICPIAHKANLEDLTDDELLDNQFTLRTMLTALRQTVNADGFNIGLNLGKAAGAGLPGHLHWHIVPRWNGDTNFMPIFTDTKVIVQSLDELWELMTKHLAEMKG